MTKPKIKLLCLVIAIVITLVFLAILFDMTTLLSYLGIWFVIGLSTTLN